jgi:hypothetical protein
MSENIKAKMAGGHNLVVDKSSGKYKVVDSSRIVFLELHSIY